MTTKIGDTRIDIEREAEQIKAVVGDEILAGFNEDQLWAIYIALERAVKTLVKPLAKADESLSKQIFNYGKRVFKWQKVSEVVKWDSLT